MKNKRILTSLNQITIPADRKESMLENVFRQADAERASLEKEQKVNTNTSGIYRKPTRRKALAILIAVIILLLAVGTAAALYFSYLSRIKEQEDSQAPEVVTEQIDDQFAAYHEGEIGEHAYYNETVELDGVTVAVEQVFINDTLEHHNVQLDLSFTGIGQERLCNDLMFWEQIETAIKLKVGDQAYLPVECFSGSAYRDVEAGQPFELMVTLVYSVNPCPKYGDSMHVNGVAYSIANGSMAAQIAGNFDFTLVYTQDAVKAYETNWVNEQTTNRSENYAAVSERLEELADQVTPLGLHGNGVEIAEIAYNDDGFYLVWLFSYEAFPDGKANRVGLCNFVTDGIPSLSESNTLWMGDLGEQHWYYVFGPIHSGLEMQDKPEQSLISFSDGASEGHYAFYYRWHDGIVTMPQDDAEKQMWYVKNQTAAEQYMAEERD